MKKLRFVIAIGAVIIVILVLFFRVKLKETLISLTKPRLPASKIATDFSPTPALQTATTTDAASALNGTSATTTDTGATVYTQTGTRTGTAAKSLPQTASKSAVVAEINLAVPFAPQAPFADWSLPYQEACEEASVIMVHRFFAGEPLDPTIMRDEILKLVEWEKKTFGYYEDTTAAEIARILREYFGYAHVSVRYDFSIDDVKREVAQGHPVILPAAGRLLGNPYFHQPGPVYHALVIRGYTKDKIITNDPGTKRGKEYLYDPAVLMNALHEWNPENILDGRPAMITVMP